MSYIILNNVFHAKRQVQIHFRLIEWPCVVLELYWFYDISVPGWLTLLLMCSFFFACICVIRLFMSEMLLFYVSEIKKEQILCRLLFILYLGKLFMVLFSSFDTRYSFYVSLVPIFLVPHTDNVCMRHVVYKLTNQLSATRENNNQFFFKQFKSLKIFIKWSKLIWFPL